MKSFTGFLLMPILSLLFGVGCQPSENAAQASPPLEMPVDTVAYPGILDSLAKTGAMTYSEADLSKAFVKLFASKLDPKWTYAEVLRRANGRAQMMENGMKGKVDGMQEVDSENPTTTRFLLSVRCQNALDATIDVFSVYFNILDARGTLIYTTTYLTNVQALAVNAWSATMPYGADVLLTDTARLKALRKLEIGHSEANFDFKMAYVKFSDGPTLDDYWLDPAR